MDGNAFSHSSIIAFHACVYSCMHSLTHPVILHQGCGWCQALHEGLGFGSKFAPFGGTSKC